LLAALEDEARALGAAQRVVLGDPGRPSTRQSACTRAAATVRSPATAPTRPLPHLALLRTGARPYRRRPRVSLEVDVLQPLAREVRVELGSGHVGMPEHLLDRVAGRSRRPTGAWLKGGAGCAGSCGPRAPRAGRDEGARSCRAPGAVSWPAAEVHEHVRLHSAADQHGAPARDGRAAAASTAWRPIGTTRSFEPLPRARSTCSFRSTSARFEADRLRGPQAAGVHGLQQRADRAAPAGRCLCGWLRSLFTSSSCEHVRKLCVPCGRRC